MAAIVPLLWEVARAGDRSIGPSGPTCSVIGDRLHRVLYSSIGGLPDRTAHAVRKLLFDSLFLMAEDPWRYGVDPYEQRKRQMLLDQVPREADVVVEIGCADGHNLLEIARRLPEAQVIGLDISTRALQRARVNAAAYPAITVLRSSAAEAAARLAEAGVRRVDALVVSETLYYIGPTARVAAEMQNVGPVLVDGATVVLLHPPQDAERFHRPVLDVLGARHASRLEFDDPQRPAVLDVGVVGGRGASRGTPRTTGMAEACHSDEHSD